jgi:hypothetical protein
MSIKLIAFTFLSISLLVAPTTNACTIFTASNGESVMFGGNEDQKPNSSFLLVDRSGTYGVVYFATPWKKWPLVPQMGINEKGLCFDTNWIPKEKLNPHPERRAKFWTIKEPGKKDRFEWVITYLLKESTTVEEVLSKIFTYDFGDSISAQFHFADKYGDAAVIHPGVDGELTYTRKPKGNSYLISTNFNLAKLVNDPKLSLKKRYKTADEMHSKIVKENDLTVESVAAVLAATHQNRWFGAKTLYSAVYDLQKLRIYLYYNRQFDEPYMLDVKEELAKNEFGRKVSLKELISDRNLNAGKN